jgi:hypothetical protein
MELKLVQSMDFIYPVADDPYIVGKSNLDIPQFPQSTYT